MHQRATGPLVQFVVVQKRWLRRIGESRPTVGERWVVDGQMCIVRSVVVLDEDRWRVFVDPDPAWDEGVPKYCGDAPAVVFKRSP